MDVPDATPLWPSASGPRIPDLATKLRKTDNLDMDSALAWLRRELVSIFRFHYYIRYHFSENSHPCENGNILL